MTTPAIATPKPIRRNDPPRPDEVRRRIQYARTQSAKSLDLRCMGLTRLPEEMFDLVELEVVFLRDNNLSSIPAEIGRLRNLRYLHLHSNLLTHLPHEVGKLHALEFLNLPNNRLSELPDRSATCDGCNDLRSLPVAVERLDSLNTLAIEGNGALGIAPELVGEDAKQILVFYFSRAGLERAKPESPG